VKEIMAELEIKDQLAELMAVMREQTARLGEHNLKLDNISVEMGATMSKVASLEEIKPALVDLALWKPKVDQVVVALQSDLGDLRLSVDKLVHAALSSSSTSAASLLERRAEPRAEAARPQSGDEVRHGPGGHRVDLTPRGSVMGPFPHTTPAKGTFPFQNHESSHTNLFKDPRDRERGKTPRVDCPSFTGEGPLEWKIKCESYFRVCRIDREIWVDTAVVYFSGEAALWLQWTNAHLSVSNWEEFVSLVCDKFGRREFEQLLRQFSRLRQTGTVAEYATQLNASMNCLLAHHHSWDPLYFVTQFVDGLRSNIRVVVMVQQPKDLDSAVSLAMFQEEAMELTREATRAGGGHATFPRAISRTVMPLPPPPVGRPPGQAMGAHAEDKRVTASTQVPSTDDKVLQSSRTLLHL
jgi:hypothetical protein